MARGRGEVSRKDVFIRDLVLSSGEAYVDGPKSRKSEVRLVSGVSRQYAHWSSVKILCNK